MRRFGEGPDQALDVPALIELDREVRAAFATDRPGRCRMTAIFDTLVTIVLFILVLGGLVLFHELGHFITARLARVRVLEFGIGFPPRAKSLGSGGVSATDTAAYARARDEALTATRNDEAAHEAVLETSETPPGTVYTLNWLPIGGFVKLEDENGGESFDPRSFGRASAAGQAGHPGGRRGHEPAARARRSSRRSPGSRRPPSASSSTRWRPARRPPRPVSRAATRW